MNREKLKFRVEVFKVIKTARISVLIFGLLLIFSHIVSAQNAERRALPAMKNPHLLIKKSARLIELFDGKKLIKTYKMVLGFAPEGDKEIEGDGKTPIGEFYVFTKNPKSNFVVSLGLSYPNIEDAQRGLRDKIISQSEYDEIVSAIKEGKMPLQKTALGGEIYIHGGGTEKDWTQGCVALEKDDITELFNTLEVGTKVKIEP